MGRRLTGLVFMAATSWVVGLHAGDPQEAARPSGAAATESPEEEILHRNGLRPMGPTYVLESELDVKKKVGEVKLLSRQWNVALLKQRSFGSPQDHQAMIQGMTAQVAQLRAEINAVSQQMRATPRFRGRMGGYYNQQQNAQLQMYRNQLNFNLNQQNAVLNQAKRQPFDAKTKQKIDEEVQTRQEEFVQGAHDLSQLVSSTKEKYGRWPETARWPGPWRISIPA